MAQRRADFLGLVDALSGGPQRRADRRERYGPGSIVKLPKAWQTRADALGIVVRRIRRQGCRFELSNGDGSSNVAGVYDSIRDWERRVAADAAD